jgi:hypothetical protein
VAPLPFIASTLLDPTALLTLPFVLLQSVGTFAISMFRQGSDFVIGMFELML